MVKVAVWFLFGPSVIHRLYGGVFLSFVSFHLSCSYFLCKLLGHLLCSYIEWNFAFFKKKKSCSIMSSQSMLTKQIQMVFGSNFSKGMKFCYPFTLLVCWMMNYFHSSYIVSVCSNFGKVEQKIIVGCGLKN